MNLLDFEIEMNSVVQNAKSLEEIETWLRSRPDITSVELANYQLKSNPPQNEFMLTTEMSGNLTETIAVNIFNDGEGQFRLNKIRHL